MPLETRSSCHPQPVAGGFPTDLEYNAVPNTAQIRSARTIELEKRTQKLLVLNGFSILANYVFEFLNKITGQVQHLKHPQKSEGQTNVTKTTKQQRPCSYSYFWRPEDKKLQSKDFPPLVERVTTNKLDGHGNIEIFGNAVAQLLADSNIAREKMKGRGISHDDAILITSRSVGLCIDKYLNFLDL